MNILIFGFGYVGQAVAHCFSPATVKVIDPQYAYSVSLDTLTDWQPEVTFICVGTPSKEDGSCDYSAVLDCLVQAKQAFPNTQIVIKSTVTPDAIDALVRVDPLLVYNPEFLTAANALQDIVEPKFIVIGGPRRNCDILLALMENFSLMQRVEDIPLAITSPKMASLAKYSINSFLALKVAFFNELHDAFALDQEDWRELTDVVLMDPRIGFSHTQVPGPDGKFGFGGACLPKDTLALTKEVKLPILETAIVENNKKRGINT